MPIPTPFHSRTSKLCYSNHWKAWAGYYTVCSYGISHEPEYLAIRHAAGLIDVTPLFKYEIHGPDAAEFLARATVKDVRRLKLGRVTYLVWCDDEGKVVDDGTLSCLDEGYFRLTAAEPMLSWLDRLSHSYDVRIEDSSDRIAVLSLQGPTSRDILKQAVDADMDALRFFGVVRCRIDGIDGWVSRTGYTGDLGYEIWVGNDDAERLYDTLMAAGAPYGIRAAGLDAMDVTRIEAGFIMNGVDYFSAHHCLTEERKTSPYELGLGWTVQLDREPFVGQTALKKEKEQGSERLFVGLDIDWAEVEAVFDLYGLPPELPGSAWRDGRPVYDENGQWIGQATSGVWSPTLKQNLALAQVEAPFAKVGTRLRIEVTAEYRRHQVTATVVETPFFNPPRKRS
ncbi:MAG: aminomethyl transferase family protein [Acidobacteria bacterium]|nr:MAG: aminomethyl transferase family protein [Acidobacteriota bacterium]